MAVLPAEPSLRLLASGVAGSLLGLHRELLGKPLGFRTLTVVSLASCALTLAAARYAASAEASAELIGRAVQGLMAGIGFLGGGVILRTGSRSVHGLTTAALVWMTAVLGVVCGLGDWPVVIVTLTLTMLCLLLGKPVEQRLARLRRDPP
jgi:putative Mg2+ transporter-C (MgtC) family protein